MKKKLFNGQNYEAPAMSETVSLECSVVCASVMTEPYEDDEDYLIDNGEE